jgi:prepilin-type N-terminal cleavage/methylation domain-containing protein
MKRLFSVKPGCEGFSLIEVMIVMAIIGILAAVAAPAYFNHMMRSRQALAVYELMAINAAQERLFAESGTYAANFGELPEYAGAGTGPYQGKYFEYVLASGVITATADLDGDPSTLTKWRLTVGEITQKPTQIFSDERFGWSSLATMMAD